MANKEELLQDLHHIRQTIDRSDQVLTLDGRLGIVNGLIGLAGLTVAVVGMPASSAPQMTGAFLADFLNALAHYVVQVVTGVLVLGACLLISYSTARRARTQSNEIWSAAALRFAYSLGLPLFLFALIAIWLLVVNPVYVPATLLIGSGLALHSAMFLSRKNLAPLSVMCISTGLLDLLMPDLGYVWLGIGLGLGNILQGVIMIANEQKA